MVQPGVCQLPAALPRQVMTGGPILEIQNHEVYPIERVEAEFSAYFLHSSLSLMSAMAILQIEDRRKARALERQRPYIHDKTLLDENDKDDVIGYWGVDMAPTTNTATSAPDATSSSSRPCGAG